MKGFSFIFYILFIICCALAVPFFTFSAGFAKEEPIQIAADKMTAVEDSQTVVFSGNVDATQGNVRIRADTMKIHYNDDNKKSGGKTSQQVKKIICSGNVEITSDEWLGTADTMNYFSKKNLIQLMGNARAFQGQNRIQGERIDYYLDTGKSEVFGAKTETAGTSKKGESSGRVNMTILEK